ncbi:MAG: MFS transporter [Bacteroidetes bacterium]|nr:MAG: MFS transporter [Bacteroidota bacterium]
MKKKCNTTFPPSRFPFFYGWVILGAGVVGVLMSTPGQTMGVSVFTEDLLEDLEINRNSLSLAYLVGTLGSGLLITRAGKLYDRHGARVMAFVAGIILGGMLLYLARVDAMVRTFDRVSPVISTFILLSFGFWGIRFFGQGMLTMISRNMVMKWFNRRRGLANAFLGIFSAFGFSLAPKILDHFISLMEWRRTWIMLGMVIGLAFTLFILVFYRDNPADCGCRADGNLPEGRKRKRPPSLPDHDFTLTEARKTLSFWAFTLALSLSALYISGFTFHIVSVFETAGLDREHALDIFIPVSVIAIVVQFICGYASDFIRLKYLLIIFLVGILTTSVGLTMLGDRDLAYWLIISGNGFVWGLYTVLIGVTWPRFFGLKNLGAISGFSLSCAVTGSALGPFLFSLSLKYVNSYAAAGLACAIISLLLLIPAYLSRNPGLPGPDASGSLE